MESGSLMWRNVEGGECERNEIALDPFYGDGDGDEGKIDFDLMDGDNKCEYEWQQDGFIMGQCKGGEDDIVSIKRSWLDWVELLLVGSACIVIPVEMRQDLRVVMKIVEWPATFISHEGSFIDLITYCLLVFGYLISYWYSYSYGVSTKRKRSLWRLIGEFCVRYLMVVFLVVNVLDGIELVAWALHHIEDPAVAIDAMNAKMELGKEMLVEQSLQHVQLAWTWMSGNED